MLADSTPPTEVTIAIISALSALSGSAIGGIISYFTTRQLNLQKWRKERQDGEIAKREGLYSQFMAEASTLLMRSVDSKDAKAIDFSMLSSLIAKMKLLSSEEVIEAANSLFKYVLQSFVVDKEKETSGDSNQKSKKFSDACRRELDALRNQKIEF